MRTQPLHRHVDQVSWKALDYLNRSRILLAALFAIFFFFTPWTELFPRHNAHYAYAATFIILITAPLFLFLGSRRQPAMGLQAAAGLITDVVLITVLIHGLDGLDSGVGFLLLPVVGAGTLLLPGRFSILLAALATLGVLGEYASSVFILKLTGRSPIEAGFYGLAFFATALIGLILARRAQESKELAERRGVDLANLAQLNELIIQRMRTGILVVDDKYDVRQMNESAWYLMGMPSTRKKHLPSLTPVLFERLRSWQESEVHDTHALQVTTGVPAIVPRFARLAEDSNGGTLLFLEDTSMVSRRAEEMTLASLGRLAASIAHEIRNPLSAISHAAQLLAESEQLTTEDHRLTEIIGNHCNRVDTIVENVLKLSRRERSKPEAVVLGPWLEYFLAEFAANQGTEEGQITVSSNPEDLTALVDPSQLRQIVFNLTENALHHGGSRDKPAKVALRAGIARNESGPVLDVIDQGPGIAPKDVQAIFQPFYTSDTTGSGLGLYIARQLCEANQARLEYLPIPTGGSCFRISFAAPRRAFKSA